MTVASVRINGFSKEPFDAGPYLCVVNSLGRGFDGVILLPGCERERAESRVFQCNNHRANRLPTTALDSIWGPTLELMQAD